jgi:EmrB/QacA subfamily drug resistance transporter
VPHTSNRQHYNITFAVLALGGMSYALLQSLVIPALPEIQRTLHASESSVGWILTAYLLSASVATPIVGRFGDMYGKERVLIIVLGALAAGTFVSAIATSMPLLLAGRVIQGIGGGIFPLAFGIIRDEFPKERVAGGIGLMSSLLGIGGGLGVVCAGLIVGHLSYHWLFWFPFIAILIATIATHFFVPESPIKTPAKINWLAAFLMSTGLVAVLLGVSQTSSWGWGSPKTIGLILAGTLTMAAWVYVEIHSDEPLVDMKMMRIRGVWTTNVVALLVGIGMYSAFILLPQFVQEPTSTGYGFGSSTLESGIFLLPCTLAMVVISQFAGRIDRTVGSKPALLSGSAFAAASFLMLVFAHSEHWQIYLAATLLGIGIGLAFAALANLIVEAVSAAQTGVATGMNTVMRTLGGALGGQIAATFLANNVTGKDVPTVHGFNLAFGMCATALIIAVLAGLAIPGKNDGERKRVRSRRPEAITETA